MTVRTGSELVCPHALERWIGPGTATGFLGFDDAWSWTGLDAGLTGFREFGHIIHLFSFDERSFSGPRAGLWELRG